MTENGMPSREVLHKKLQTLPLHNSISGADSGRTQALHSGTCTCQTTSTSKTAESLS